MSKSILFALTTMLLLLKLVAINITSFDLFGDEAQYWLWSKDLNFGYFSKPPFLAWMISFYTGVFGDSFFALKTMPIIVYFLIAWSVYVLCNNMGLDKSNSISCSLIFLILPAVSVSTFIISTDIFLLLFWCLSLNELVKIKIKPNIKSFVLLGVFLGLAFLSKYAAIYFIICLLLYVLLDKKFREVFIKNYFGFLLSAFCIITILLPNIFWNINNGWITVVHTSDNANLNNLDINLLRGLLFLFTQILMLGPIIFFAYIVDYKKWSISEYQKLLLIFSLPIFIIVTFEAIVVRANANWAAPALISFFIFLYIGVNNNFLRKLNLGFNFFFCIIFFVLIGTNFSSGFFNRISGLSEFAEKIYFERSQKNLVNFVVSDRLLFASMSYQLRNRGLYFHMPHESGSKITNHFKITSPLKKNMSENFVFIGTPNEIKYLENNYIINKKNTPKYNFTKKNINIYEVVFN